MLLSDDFLLHWYEIRKLFNPHTHVSRKIYLPTMNTIISWLNWVKFTHMQRASKRLDIPLKSHTLSLTWDISDVQALYWPSVLGEFHPLWGDDIMGSQLLFLSCLYIILNGWAKYVVCSHLGDRKVPTSLLTQAERLEVLCEAGTGSKISVIFCLWEWVSVGHLMRNSMQ